MKNFTFPRLFKSLFQLSSRLFVTFWSCINKGRQVILPSLLNLVKLSWQRLWDFWRVVTVIYLINVLLFNNILLINLPLQYMSLKLTLFVRTVPCLFQAPCCHYYPLLCHYLWELSTVLFGGRELNAKINRQSHQGVLCMAIGCPLVTEEVFFFYLASLGSCICQYFLAWSA